MFGRAALIFTYVSVVTGFTAIPVFLGWLLLDWSVAAVFTWALFSCVMVSAIMLHVLTSSGYLFTDKALKVSSSGKTKHILFQSVVRVERVRHRAKGIVQEGVRIVYRQGPNERQVTVKPENSILFVHDLVSKCPHLTSFNQRRLPHLSSIESSEEDNKLMLICA